MKGEDPAVCDSMDEHSGHCAGRIKSVWERHTLCDLYAQSKNTETYWWWCVELVGIAADGQKAPTSSY